MKGQCRQAKYLPSEAVLQHQQSNMYWACRNILKYIGYGHDKPEARDNEVNAPPNVCAYLVTEYVDGKTLKNKVLEQVCTQTCSLTKRNLISQGRCC